MKVHDGAVYDLTGLGRPLPLALARKAENRSPAAPPVTTCSKCGVRYFTRPVGSQLAEDGLCRECSEGREPLPLRSGRNNVATFQERSRARGRR